MKTSLAKGLDGETILMFWCPGCDEAHGPIVERTDASRPLWTWNNDRERPTFSPSLLVRGTRRLTEEEYQRVISGEHVTPEPHVCHSFVRDGQIEFLSDCTHALKAQTVPIPDWPFDDEDAP